jgi:hypothetical protein
MRLAMSDEYRTVPQLSETTEVQGNDLIYTVVAPQSGGQDRKATFNTLAAYFRSIGLKGDPATLTLGTVTVVDPDQQPSIVNSGTTVDAVFDFDFPRAASVTLGSVSVVNPNQLPDVTDVGTDGDVVLNVDVPRASTFAVGTVTAVNPNDPAVVTDVGTDGDIVLNFEIPTGGTSSVQVLNDLTDVSAASPQGGQVLAFNATNSDYELVTLTASDVGAYSDTNPASFVDATGAAAAAPVQSVNTLTGTVTLDAASVGAAPTTRQIATSGTGLSGGGDLTTDRTITLDPAALAADSAFSSLYASPDDVLALVIALGG